MKKNMIGMRYIMYFMKGICYCWFIGSYIFMEITVLSRLDAENRMQKMLK